MILSIIAAALAAGDTLFKVDILNLAGTQWMLIAIVLGVWGNHAEACGCCSGKSGSV